MGTEKRERQKANRAKAREQQVKAAKVADRKRKGIRGVAIVVAGLAALLLIVWIAGGFDDDGSSPVDTLPPATLPTTTLPAESGADTAADTDTATASDTATATDTATSAPATTAAP